MIKKLCITLLLSLPFTLMASEAVEKNKELENNKIQINMPDMKKVLQQNLNIQYQNLASKIKDLKEKEEKEKKILTSYNQNIIFKTNMIKNEELDVNLIQEQKSINYKLKIDLLNKTLILEDIFKNSSEDDKDLFEIPFKCNKTCEAYYKINSDGKDTFGKLVLNTTDKINKTEIEEKSFLIFLDKLENADNLMIYTETYPFGLDKFTFIFVNNHSK